MQFLQAIGNLYGFPPAGQKFSIEFDKVIFECGYLTVNSMTSGEPNCDGKLTLTINGVTQNFDKFIWTTTDSLITGIIFTTFFGGSDSSWATPVATSTYYKKFQLSKEG